MRICISASHLLLSESRLISLFDVWCIKQYWGTPMHNLKTVRIGFSELSRMLTNVNSVSFCPSPPEIAVLNVILRKFSATIPIWLALCEGQSAWPWSQYWHPEIWPAVLIFEASLPCPWLWPCSRNFCVNLWWWSPASIKQVTGSQLVYILETKF